MSAYRQGSGHMNAAVLYGAENLKIETVDIPRSVTTKYSFASPWR